MTDDAAVRLSTALEGRYRVVRPAGSGGMATVYLADDLRHDRRVALKVLRPDFAASLGSRRFLDEIRIAAKLTHPHIMPVHDSGEADGLLYFVMPFIEGDSLRDIMDRDGEMPVEVVVELIAEILGGLAHAHAHGVVHRDVKPGNVLTVDGHAVIVDFGVAKAFSVSHQRVDADMTAEGMAIGTPAYMAPEQAAADPHVDHRADLYAVGVLAYEMLAGRKPFAGGSPESILTRQITETPTPVETHRPAVSSGLAAWVSRSLEKRPEDRWSSAGEMLAALRAVDPLTAESPDPTAGRTAGRRRGLALAGVAAAALAIGVAGWAVTRGGGIPETSRIVVDVFENQTGVAAFDPAGYMLQDWLTDGLLRSDLLEVVPTPTARQASDYVGLERRSGGGGDPVAALAEETGADIVVSGSIFLEEQSSELHIRTTVTDVTDPAEPRLVATLDPVVGPPGEITPLFDRVREQLLGVIGTATNRRLAAQVGVGSHAPTYAAYESLSLGLDLYANREYAQASRLFLQAYELDPTYPVPLLYASLSLRNHNDWARSDSVVTLLERRQSELSEYQLLWVRYSRAILEGNMEAARVAIRRAAVMSPESKAAYNWALVAVRMGRPNEAREALGSLDPDRGAMRGISRYWMRQLEASHELGEHERELEQVEELERRHPEERALLYNKIWVYAALGWVESLRAVFAEAEGTRIPPDVIAVRYRTAATELAIHGHEEAAAELARQGIAFIDRQERRESDSAYNLGITLTSGQQLLYQKGRLLEVLDERPAALAIYRELASQAPNAWFLRAHAGVVAASLGQISVAMDTDRWLQTLEVPYSRGEQALWRAGIAARLGDHERAVRLLEEARDRGTYWTTFHPVLHLYDALADYAPWQAFMAPRG